MFNFGDNSGDITGSVGGEEKPAGPPLKVSDKAPDLPKVQVGDVSVPIEAGHLASSGERAVLERLQERRKELDTRSRELEMRESLLKATEKRLEAKVAEIKDVEARVNTAMGTRDKEEAQRFKDIVTMYENMKPKDAARIMERLDMKILVEVASAIKPAVMASILAQMTPEGAEKLTVELARRADGKSQAPGDLPKIEGKPAGT
jgi:flagellar motility protein MotE (MotC chaperone)